MPRVKVGPAPPDASTPDVEIARLRDLDVASLQARSRNVRCHESHAGAVHMQVNNDRFGSGQERVSGLMAFFEAPAPSLIGMEACATAHHWARELTKLGHEVRLVPAKDVKAYVKRNKNDAADAEAICEAVRRPTIRLYGSSRLG